MSVAELINVIKETEMKHTPDIYEKQNGSSRTATMLRKANVKEPETRVPTAAESGKHNRAATIRQTTLTA